MEQGLLQNIGVCKFKGYDLTKPAELGAAMAAKETCALDFAANSVATVTKIAGGIPSKLLCKKCDYFPPELVLILFN